METQTTVSNAGTKLVDYDEIPFCIKIGEENEVPHISSNYCDVVYDDKLSL
ncbi:hypothetical protein CRE_02871 [Caenorhabditis remanei]|uniref:Uncharacterized protein n=1 Tax=Caenorhabditis remanei TaxID=31234 RepID=E3LWD0_CAERE|nr:hypothetical protein CRE_02871 [Caenorhabditis remanei]